MDGGGDGGDGGGGQDFGGIRGLNCVSVDLLNSQAVLRGRETSGFLLISAARASITQRYHVPVWKDAQLLLKRSVIALLSGLQYFAPLSIGAAASTRAFQWLSREIIEEKNPSVPADKINNYSSSGEAVGGVVTSEFFCFVFCFGRWLVKR